MGVCFCRSADSFIGNLQKDVRRLDRQTDGRWTDIFILIYLLLLFTFLRPECTNNNSLLTIWLRLP